MKHATAESFLSHVALRNPGQPEFLQAVTEVMESLWPFIAQHPRYAEHGLLEVSGVDINTPRQVFNCPELQRPELGHLNDATWAMVAHELLAEADPDLGLFAPGSPLAAAPLTERIARYAAANAGRFKIDHIIFEQKIWTPYRPYWRPMEDRGSITQNHYDHVHISIGS